MIRNVVSAVAKRQLLLSSRTMHGPTPEIPGPVRGEEAPVERFERQANLPRTRRRLA